MSVKNGDITGFVGTRNVSACIVREHIPHLIFKARM